MQTLSLKETEAICLISCYELGHQPLGLASPMAFLERAGFRPAAIDTAVEGFDEERLRRARFAGISVPMHTALRLGSRIAHRIRKSNPACHICFYGLYASLNAEHLLDHVADSVVGGEFEGPLLDLVEALEMGISTPIEGVSRKGQLASPYLKRLPFSVPRRSVLPRLDNYARLQSAGGESVAGYVEASRGCKHLCLHCPIPPVYKGRFFVIPEDVVIEDIRQLVRSGAVHITFGDPDFLNGPGHSLRIVRAMHDEFPELTFDFTAKVEHLIKRRSLMRELALCGCIFVVSAVESLSDRVLANLEKGHTRADVIRALAILRDAGIALRPSLVSFTPWTTLEDYLDVLNFVESEDLVDSVDPVQYAIRLLVPPGSSLLSRAAIQPYLGDLMPDSFTYNWKHPDPRMDLLHQDVTALVERAANIGDDDFVTFGRVRELAAALCEGRAPDDVYPLPPAYRVRAPRLTEPWFC